MKVTKLKRIDENESLLEVTDSSVKEPWSCKIYTTKYRWLREGQFVRLNHASLFNIEMGKREFSLRFAGNILTVPAEAKISEDI